MKVVADENIPWISHYFGDAIQKPGREITNHDLKEADILLVRSVTKVNQALLENTPVKFVGTTTTGMDHFNTKWMDAHHILYRAAEGCNAVAVVEYVIACIASLQKRNFLPDKKLRAAVIGVGRIGSLVSQKLKLLNFEVVECDPIRADKDPHFMSTPLEEISDVDLISLHTPLTKEGVYPTFHMINKNFLERQKNNAILLNTSRGGVISSEDLKLYGGHLIWCLDVFEHEPYVDFEILDEALIATPHIAGYSEEARYRGIEMIYRFARDLNIIHNDVDLIPFPKKTISFGQDIHDWRDVILTIYDPYLTSHKMKLRMIEDPNHAFDEMRNHFHERSELAFIELPELHLDERNLQILKMLLCDC